MAYEVKLIEILILLCMLAPPTVESHNFTLIGTCNSALGMEEGRIPDSAITASSSYESKSVGPRNARVRQEKNGGAWCPKAQISLKVREYLEIDLAEPHLITYIETQGRFGNGQGQEYAEYFTIEYWREPLKNWVVYKDHQGNKIMAGNTNTYLGVKQKLELPFVASKIRFVPFSEHPRTVCMRVEIYGCPWQQNLTSYTAPRADTEFDDISYDGVIEDRIMAYGLGQLVDNILGDKDFLNHNQQSGNKKWVGWLNDANTSLPLELFFEFARYNRVTDIMLHMSHFKTREVQVFSEAEVFTSVDGTRYYENPVKVKPALNRLRDGTHNVTISFDVKIAKFLKLLLYFSARWILISEIRFVSKPVEPNQTEELLLKYNSLVDIGVQPRQSASDKNYNGKELKINFIKGEVYIVILTVFVIVLLICGAVLMAFVVKKNRQTKLMRKHAVLPSSSFPPPPFAIKELEITTPIVDTLNASRCRQIQGVAVRDRTKSTGNIYISNDINAPINESEESDTSSSYHELYKRIPMSKHEYCLTGGKESVMNGGGTVAFFNNASFDEKRENSSFSLYNLSTRFPILLSRTKTAYSDVDSPPATFNKTINNEAEHYYAAADVIQDGGNYSSTEQHFALGKFTPLKLPDDLNSDSYECDAEPSSILLEFSRHRLKVIEKLGEGNFGMIHLCETEFSCDKYGHVKYHKKQMIVKSMRRSISEEIREKFFRECNQLASIRDPNISKIIGICSKDDPVSALQEYSEFGDLPKFLRQHIKNNNENTNPFLNINFLLFLAAQIASAMKYLESRKIIHRDLAARNCMVCKNYVVKVSDHSIYCSQYENDYYTTDKKSRLPIRWMAWESVLLGKHSSWSDVWSFSVTLWEILTLCEQRPFAEYTNDQVIENYNNYYEALGDRIKYLERPKSCPKDIYEMMRECWRRNNTERPSFTEIHFFLKRKNLGYNPVL